MVPGLPLAALEEARQNVVHFNEHLNDGDEHGLSALLALVHHWYFDPRSELWGPSKYIGYRNMTPGNYFLWRDGVDATTYSDGRETESQLRRFTEEITEDDSRYDALNASLHGFLAHWDRSPRSGYHLHLFPR